MDQSYLDNVRRISAEVRNAVEHLQEVIDTASNLGLEVDLVQLEANNLGENPNRVILDVSIHMDVAYLGEEEGNDNE